MYCPGSDQFNLRKQLVDDRFGKGDYKYTPFVEEVKTRERETKMADLCEKYLQEVEDTIAENMPNDTRVNKVTKEEKRACFIPCGLFGSKLAVYNDFVRATKARVANAVVPSWSTFYRVWRVSFWFLFLRHWIPFAKCDHCVELLESIRTAKTEEERAKFKEEQVQHRDYIKVCRKNYQRRIDDSIEEPDKYLSVIVDAMDSNKTNVPHWRSFFSKERAEFTCKTRLLGVLVHGRRFDGYWTLPRFEHSSNLTIACLLKTFAKILQDEGKLPPFLVLQLDNCGKENKCNNFFAFLGLLVELKVFQEVFVNFLPVGHTHSDIDQKYSVYSHRLGSVDAYTIPQLITAVKDLFTKKLKVSHEEVPEVCQLQSVLQPKKDCFHLKGLGTIRDAVTKMKRRAHSFRVYLSEGKACLQYKEHDVADQQWLGHHLTDDGIPIFTQQKYDREEKG